MVDQPAGPPSTTPSAALPDVPAAAASASGPHAGQVGVAWQIMLGATWSAVFLAYAATWKVSEEIGIGTWWLGARAQPQPVLVKIVPFALATLISLAAIYNAKFVALISLAGSGAAALIAVFDMSRSGGLAAIEFAIAGAAALVSVAAFTGTYRPHNTRGQTPTATA